MKAGDLFMVQFCGEHGGFRVLPLRTCEQLAELDMQKGVLHPWVVVGHAAKESEAHTKMKGFKQVLRQTEKQPVQQDLGLG